MLRLWSIATTQRTMSALFLEKYCYVINNHIQFCLMLICWTINISSIIILKCFFSPINYMRMVLCCLVLKLFIHTLSVYSNSDSLGNTIHLFSVVIVLIVEKVCGFNDHFYTVKYQVCIINFTSLQKFKASFYFFHLRVTLESKY